MPKSVRYLLTVSMQIGIPLLDPLEASDPLYKKQISNAIFMTLLDAQKKDVLGNVYRNKYFELPIQAQCSMALDQLYTCLHQLQGVQQFFRLEKLVFDFQRIARSFQSADKPHQYLKCVHVSELIEIEMELASQRVRDQFNFYNPDDSQFQSIWDFYSTQEGEQNSGSDELPEDKYDQEVAAALNVHPGHQYLTRRQFERLISDSVLAGLSRSYIRRVWDDYKQRIRQRDENQTIFSEVKSRIDQMTRAVAFIYTSRLAKNVALDDKRYIHQRDLKAFLTPKQGMVSAPRGIEAEVPQSVFFFVKDQFRHWTLTIDMNTNLMEAGQCYEKLVLEHKVVFERCYKHFVSPDVCTKFGW
eukprot:TRINITY_DN789_c0_g2_i5.p1 TRINITY_DN789_c0_g2~~TRINITY_DN789_c0_g2_i5.p1  ORF type:complete len:357 (+),score=141.71 TRINITY_DN789_c0_g2_i5:78-1148(+)